MSPGAHWPPSFASRWPGAGPSSPAATAADGGALRPLSLRAGAPLRCPSSVGGPPVADGGPPAAPGAHFGAAPPDGHHHPLPGGICVSRRAHALPRLLPSGVPPQLATAAGTRQPLLPHPGGGWTATQRGLPAACVGAPPLAKPSGLAFLVRGQLRLGLHQLPRLAAAGAAGLRLLPQGAGGVTPAAEMGAGPCSGACRCAADARAGLPLPCLGPPLAPFHHPRPTKLEGPGAGASLLRPGSGPLCRLGSRTAARSGRGGRGRSV